MTVKTCNRMAQDLIRSVLVHKDCTPEEFDQKWDSIYKKIPLSAGFGGGLHSLLLASSFGNVKLVVHLARKDISLIDLGDQTGTTPLIASVHGDHPIVAECLISLEADMNIANLKGETAFGLALKKSNFIMIRLFVKYEAIASPEPDAQGQRLIEIAQKELQLLATLNTFSLGLTENILETTVSYLREI